jgi:hypothetical protein
MTANELVERYVHEVGQQLPRNIRADVQMELRSLLQDSLEEQAAESGVAPTTKMTAEMLRAFGKPETIAARYRPEQYLIGPRLFPIYRQVITVALVIISIIHVAGLLFALLRGETAVFGQAAWGWLSNFFNAALVNAGIVTLVFVALERAQVIDWYDSAAKEAEWNPLDLPPIADDNRINRLELGFGMIWTAAFLILFNFYPQWIGVATIANGETGFFPFFAPAFAVHVPWLTLIWMLELMLKSVVLAQGRWTTITRWLELSLVPLTIFVLNRIRTGGEIFTIAGLTTAARQILAVIIVIVVLDGVYLLYKQLRRQLFSFGSRPV